MTYHERLTSHLSTYRKDVLKVEEPGSFKHKGRKLLKEHILAPDQRGLNLLPSVRGLIENYLREHPVTLHRYFHHLNSSQAFALNLFVPYFEGGAAASDCLLRALGVVGSLASWKAEQVPYSEEETSIDVSWLLMNGDRTICEVKLSESNFGVAKEDERHLRKIAATYMPILQGHVDEELLQPKLFCKHYQILRLAWCAVKDPAVILMFLLPRANAKLWQKLSKIRPLLGEELGKRIREVAMEDVLERLMHNLEMPPALQQHARELRAKYVLPEAGEPR